MCPIHNLKKNMHTLMYSHSKACVHRQQFLTEGTKGPRGLLSTWETLRRETRCKRKNGRAFVASWRIIRRYI